MTLPRTIDRELTPRVSTTTAGKYLGRTRRWVEREIRAGRLRAIDTSKPGSPRPCWAIAVADLRARVAQAEAQAAWRIRDAQESESERAENERNGRTQE